MSIYNEDELVPPTWINHEFIQKVLNHHEKTEEVKLIDFDLTPASLKGDHYGSIMFRIKISYVLIGSGETKKTSWIIKTLPAEDCHKRDMLLESGVFETEISMYSETIPKIEEILEKAGIGSKMGAKLIYHSLTPHKLVIMEDLCEAGYDALRGRYINEEEVKCVYRKLAKLHAVSHMLGQSEEHEIVTRYRGGLFCSENIMKMDFVRNGIFKFIEMLKEHEEFAVYYEKVKAMEPQMFPICMDLYKAYSQNQGKGDIFVLNHGDFHLKNLMFKFDENNKVEDIIMVDFQVNVYGPSCIDTTYSQYNMLSRDLRLKAYELQQFYFTEFVNTLKTLKFQGELPLYSDFRISTYRYRHFGLFLMSTFVPMFGDVVVAKAEDLKDVETTKILQNEDLIKNNYKNPNFLNDMRRYLPILLRDGYLD